MKTTAGTYAVISIGVFLASVLAFGLNPISTVLAFLSGYFFGISSPESKMNAEYAKLMVRSKEINNGLSRPTTIIPFPATPKKEEE